MSNFSTPLFADDWWGSSSPAGTTLTAVVSASNHDAIGFKFQHTVNSDITALVLLWSKSASGVPSVNIGVEHLTNGVPSTTANYVDGLYKAAVVPTPTAGNVVESIEFLPGELGALTVGGSYALTIRYNSTDGGKTISVSMLSGTATGGGTRNSVAALTKSGSGAFSVSASRAVGVLVYENNFGVNDTNLFLRNMWPILTSTLTPILSSSTYEVQGMKWTQSRSGVLSGVSWFGQVANTVTDTSGADVVLFENDVEVFTQYFEFNAYRNGGSSGTFFLPLTQELVLKPGSVYRMCFRGVQATHSIQTEVVTMFPDTTFATAVQLRELYCGPGHYCYKDGSNPWQDDTNKVCSMTPITHESLVDASGGGGGPVTSGV